MKVEIGKKYITRHGDIVKILEIGNGVICKAEHVRTGNINLFFIKDLKEYHPRNQITIIR